ncbi:hypothetical protein ACF0H5_002182 [Mactra antiquata]
MSYNAHHAFTRNHTLQKQLEDKFLTLRRSFKHSRRRHDTLEEECLSSLYKLLLYAKEKQEDTETEEPAEETMPKRPHSVFDNPTKQREHKERPKTSMTSKTYTQSYSFSKNGMNIHKATRDRYIRSKKEKEMSKEPVFKIERLEPKRDLERNNTSMTSLSNVDDTDDEISSPRRPKTAPANSDRHRTLSRPQIKITLPGTDETSESSTAPIQEQQVGPVSVLLDYPGEGNLRQMIKSISGQGRYLPPPRPHNGVHTTQKRLSNAHDLDTVDGDIRSLTQGGSVRAESRASNPGEEYLIPLSVAEQKEFDTLCEKKPDCDTPRTSFSPSRSGSRIITPRNGTELPNSGLLKKSCDKTQTFLTQYSKKSKLFGYVVKTRASPLTPRDRVMSHRSPCITFQELASIKAGIKQHASKTRSLIQRSAKLSIYVDKLANGSLLREHMQVLKDARASKH